MQDGEKKDYEISFLGKTEGSASDVETVIQKSGGEITFRGPSEKIMLAYPIRKETTAQFGYFHFTALPSMLTTIERELRTRSSVLRFLILHPPFVKAKPRSATQPKPPSPAPAMERRRIPSPPLAPLSNEALERKIEEILQD